MESRAPSGLFPGGPPRPAYREPHPVRVGAVLAGAAVAAGWLLLVGLLAETARGYFWLTVTAAILATLAALVLVRYGDRGVAAGVAISSSVGLAAAAGLVVYQWVTAGWPLW